MSINKYVPANIILKSFSSKPTILFFFFFFFLRSNLQSPQKIIFLVITHFVYSRSQYNII